MFGFKLIHEAELEKLHREQELELRAKDVELKVTLRRAEAAEKTAEYWEGKAQEFLDRSDRQLDGFLQQNGLPQVTTTARKEAKQGRDEAEAEFERRHKEMAEIFADSINTLHDVEGLELPPDLAEAAKGLMEGVKANG